MLSVKLMNRLVFSSCRCATKSNYFCQIKIRNIVSKTLVSKAEEKKDKREVMMKDLKENFEPIYRFPSIGSVAAINNVKSYQGVVTFFGLPVTYFFFPEYLLEFAYSGITLFMVLSLTSLILRNSIGAVYIHKKNNDVVRIAFIDFWGRRKDSEFNVDDIIPFSQQKQQGIGDKIFSKVKFNDEKHTELKFLSKNYLILDLGKFSQVFGEY